MSYAQDFYEYLKNHKLNVFTHRDILLHTNTNCSYSVLVDLRVLLFKIGLELKEEEVETINSKGQKRRFKQYEIIER